MVIPTNTSIDLNQQSDFPLSEWHVSKYLPYFPVHGAARPARAGAPSPDRADYQANKLVRRDWIQPSQNSDDATCRIYPSAVAARPNSEETLG
jgi:hypothetical protein